MDVVLGGPCRRVSRPPGWAPRMVPDRSGIADGGDRGGGRDHRTDESGPQPSVVVPSPAIELSPGRDRARMLSSCRDLSERQRRLDWNGRLGLTHAGIPNAELTCSVVSPAKHRAAAGEATSEIAPGGIDPGEVVISGDREVGRGEVLAATASAIAQLPVVIRSPTGREALGRDGACMGTSRRNGGEDVSVPWGSERYRNVRIAYGSAGAELVAAVRTPAVNPAVDGQAAGVFVSGGDLAESMAAENG